MRAGFSLRFQPEQKNGVRGQGETESCSHGAVGGVCDDWGVGRPSGDVMSLSATLSKDFTNRISVCLD